MIKDIVKDRYDKFCLRASLSTFLAVFLIMIALGTLFAQKLVNQNFFESIVIAIAFSVSFLLAVVGIYKQNRLERITYGKQWPIFAITLGITYGYISGILGHIFAFIMTNTLHLNTMMPIWVSCLTALFCGGLACGTTKGVFRLNQQKYLLLVVSAFAIGFCASIILTQNQDWWKTSICSLGMPIYANSQYYNYALMITGLLSALFAYYLRPQIRSLVAKRILDGTSVFALTALFFMEMIAIALIGVFPYGLFEWMNPIHMFFVYFGFFNIVVILLFGFWFFRKFPWKFLVVNYLLLVIGGALYYISSSDSSPIYFAIAEILIIAAFIAWVALFLKTIRRMNYPQKQQILSKNSSL